MNGLRSKVCRTIGPIVALVLTLSLQAADPSLLTLERLYGGEEFTSETFGPVRWLKRDRAYLILEDSSKPHDGKEIVSYDPESGKRTVLVTVDRLIPEGESRPLEVDDFQLSPDETRVLIFANSRRVWRRKTRGDYWILNLNGGKPLKLGGDAAASRMMFAKFSPAGDRVGYVYQNDIYVQDLNDMGIVRLTHDGSDTLINGTFDWVYEEEFDLRDGFRWSPDGLLVAFWQLDSAGVSMFHMINNTDSLYPTVSSIPYPKVGQVNSACRVGIVNSSGGPPLWLALPGDPRNHYVARLEWAGNSEEVVLQFLNRLQNTNRVMLGDARSGEVRTVFVDRDDTWVDVCDGFRWLDGGRRFLYVSERDGWRHAFRVSRSGDDVDLITPEPFDVLGIEGVDESTGWLYFIASPEEPGQRFLFRTRLDGGDKPRRVTPAGAAGTHSYALSPGAGWAFHTHSTFESPETVELIRLPGHETVRVLEDNRDLKMRVAALRRTPVEFFRVETEPGILLDGWSMKPPDFAPEKKYPALFYVYGEPGGQTVRDRWSRTYLWHLMLTQQGYLVISVDNRGTPAPRGRQWRHSIYGRVGILSSQDQAAAVRAILKKFPHVDGSRIGFWGWSGGGSMSLNMIFRYPDLVHTAMAVAPVSDQRYYDSIYQERYMGLPDTNPEGFKLGSPITFAHRLKGHLLLVHGTGDDNVHYQNTEALVNELIAHNKPFSMMAYPNRSHGIREGKNTTRHLFELLTRYLKDHLPPGPH